jgi:carbonic anhydrase
MEASSSSFAAVRERNAAFAERGAFRDATIMPRLALMVLTCLDPRLEPASFLGIELGDAAVLRNAGGRVTDAVLADVAFIGQLAAAGLPEGPLFELAIVHHNQCGTAVLADPGFRERLAARTGEDPGALERHAVLDPEATVREDVALIRGCAAVPDRVRVSGHVYDVTSGRVTTVV